MTSPGSITLARPLTGLLLKAKSRVGHSTPSLALSSGQNSDSASPRRVQARHWVALIGAMLGAFMAVLDIQITNASLPDILGSLGSTLDEGSWVSTSYLVAE